MSKYQPVNPENAPRFSGIRTFMRLPHVTTVEDVDFVVVGLPYDCSTTFRPGTRFGPSAIREVSAFATKPYNPHLDVAIFEYCSGVDYGDLGTIPGYLEESFDLITEGMLPIFQNGVIPVAMGGDHSVTLPELRACHQAHGPVALIHFDAHYDTMHDFFGKPHCHGTPFYHAAVEGLVDTSKSIQVGIRAGLHDPASLNISKDLGYDVLTASECNKMSTEQIIDRIVQRVGDSKAFLTFDIDYLDPAYAPGTGTPVPGGATTAQALDIIRGLKALNIIGYDLVEVAPHYDHSEITSLAAAALMAEFLGHIAWRKKHQLG
ncbi:MAG: agmatinase [Enterobacteriaceae bacterium]